MWDRIAIHHTVTPDGDALVDLEMIRDFHTAAPPRGRGWSDVGYHWIVEKVSGFDGSFYAAIMARPMYRTGSHVGGHNTGTLGVALVGDYSSAKPPLTQIECAAELCAALCRTNGIRTDQIHPHRHFKDTLCPGTVPIGHIRALVSELRGGSFSRARSLRGIIDPALVA